MFLFINFVLLQTLSTLLHCQTLEEVKLSGRDMFSLKELVLNKSSQVGEVFFHDKLHHALKRKYWQLSAIHAG